jgi:hypothetical protein
MLPDLSNLCHPQQPELDIGVLPGQRGERQGLGKDNQANRPTSNMYRGPCDDVDRVPILIEMLKDADGPDPETTILLQITQIRPPPASTDLHQGILQQLRAGIEAHFSHEAARKPQRGLPRPPFRWSEVQSKDDPYRPGFSQEIVQEASLINLHDGMLTKPSFEAMCALAYDYASGVPSKVVEAMDIRPVNNKIRDNNRRATGWYAIAVLCIGEGTMVEFPDSY